MRFYALVQLWRRVGPSNARYLAGNAVCYRVLLAGGLALTVGGCAIRYHDAETGAEHFWGIGHFVARSTEPVANRVAVIFGSDTAGVALDASKGEYSFAVGWASNRRVEIVNSDTAVQLQYSGDLVGIRVGAPPETIEGEGERQ